MNNDRGEPTKNRALNVCADNHLPPVCIPEHLDKAGLSPAQYRVYCHFAHLEVKIAPTIKSIAKRCQLHHDTVRGAIRDLVSQHMIALVESPGLARKYVLTSAESWTCGKTNTRSAKQVSLEVERSCQKGVLPSANATTGSEPQDSAPPFKAQAPPISKAEDSPQIGVGSIDNSRVVREDKQSNHHLLFSGLKKGVPLSANATTGSEPKDSAPPFKALPPPISKAEDSPQIGATALSVEDRERISQALVNGHEETAVLVIAVAIGAVMQRCQSPSQWGQHEKRAFVELCSKRGVPTNEEIAVVAARYAAEWPPGEGNFLRRHLYTLLTHWDCEVDRARHFVPSWSATPHESESNSQPLRSIANRKDVSARQAYIIPGFSGPTTPADYIASRCSSPEP